jgi:hypothetical protein
LARLGLIDMAFSRKRTAIGAAVVRNGAGHEAAIWDTALNDGKLYYLSSYHPTGDTTNRHMIIGTELRKEHD